MIYKIFNWFSGLAFIGFAALQYNDPDPLVWMAVYGVSAILCFVALSRHSRYYYHLIFFVFCTGWAFMQWPAHFEGFDDKVVTLNMEMARESMGLAICAGVALLNGIVGYFKRAN